MKTKSAMRPVSQWQVYRVDGTVTSLTSAGVGNLKVEVVDKNAGPDVVLATASTDANGYYSLTFKLSAKALKERLKAQPDLQARVSREGKFLAASDVAYSAPPSVVLNVRIPPRVNDLPSEHETLKAALATVFKGALGTLQETGERSDITYLANKTGWDARAVALAALADRFAGNLGTRKNAAAAIKPEFYYALFRAGLPANATTLYQTDPQTVSSIWNQAMAQGVISSSLRDEAKTALSNFQNLASTHILDTPPIPNASSVGVLLQITLGDDSERQQQFAELYTQYQSDLPAFWAALEKRFGAAITQDLQLDGQLAFLTLNNAQLITNLHESAPAQPLTSLLDLVRLGYYEPSKWQEVMNGVSSDVMPGSTPAEKQTNYISLLTAQLRLSYPTAVLSEMVNSGSIPITTDQNLRVGIYQFLVQNEGKFEIGVQMIDQYVADNKLQVDPNVIAQIKRLQRVYQVTPTDVAMNALLGKGVDSAYAIVHYGKAAFVATFEAEMGGEEIATEVFLKAQSVHNAVLNVTTDYLVRRTAPVIGNGTTTYLGPMPQATTPAQISSVSATLETLFGSLDYCACDECRSILGPAAYLVDLLNFTNCVPPPAGSANPQDVLFARRPDLQYLLLTCDNTNIALPYIDLVNETLEYFVANGSLSGYQGYTTDGKATSSEELIASPQNVNDAAYTKLKSILFPPPLPFDRSLELQRALFQKFDVNLGDAMAALRPNDSIERPPGATAYGWRDILMEEIGLSREEYQILTDSTLKLQDLYGYDPSKSDADTLVALSSVQDYSRRLGISYDALLEILETHFINPFGTLIPQLESLGVPFGTIAQLKSGGITAAAFLALLPTGLNAPDPANFGGDIVAWLLDANRYQQIMGLITIANPSDNSALCSMAGLQFRYSDPAKLANPLNPIDFVRLMRFVRLWKKLGLTIEQTDDVITALAPTMSAANTLVLLDKAWLTLLPRIGFAYRLMTELDLSIEDGLSRVLACWGDIGIYGDDSLYAEMFLNPTILQQDPAFAPNSNGQVLQDATQTIMATATQQKVVVAGTITLNDVLTTTIDGISITYTVGAGDTSTAILADNIAKAINGTATLDPAKGVPLNTVVTATSSGNQITIAAVGNSGAFVLGSSVSLAGTETYVSLDHAPALRAAFNLTGAEFALITASLGFTSTTPLTLDNISKIYRRGWLARQLEISVAEFLLLVQCTGLDPFSALDPSTAAPAEPPAVRFIRLVQTMAKASLLPVEALYLLWNQDISGTSAPSQADINALAFTLREDFAAVDRQFALKDDPNGTIAISLMSLIYGSAATNFFFGLLNNTLTVSVSYGDGASPALLAASQGRLAYDDLGKQLSYSGVLDAATLAALQAQAAGNAPLLAAINALLVLNQEMVNPFFAQYPELLLAYNAFVASSDSLQNRRSKLLAGLLPSLEAKRKQEQALAAVSAAAGIDSTLAEALFGDAAVMQAAAGPSQTAISDLTAVEAQGLAAQFFLTNNVALPPDQIVDNVASLVYEAGGAHQLPPGNGGSKIAGIWSGYIDCPADGNYNLMIIADPGAIVSLIVGGASVSLSNAGNVWTNTSAVFLTAGELTSVSLTATGLTSRLSFSWQTTGTGVQVVPGQFLYSQNILVRLASSYTRFLKAASLARQLLLDASEMVHLAKDPDLQVGGMNWLNALPVAGTASAGISEGLTGVLNGILTFARLKQALSPKDERFLNVLKNPATTLPNQQSALWTLTQWNPDSANALLVQFFGNSLLAPLEHIANFARVFDAYAVVSACGIGAWALITATTNVPVSKTVADFEAAVRARYAQSDWLAVIQPINNAMRKSQRDALVPYVLELCAAQNAVVDVNTPVNTADTLFEYLLMDVEMQPCMLTSRIRHALSSVQLFIERCIRGLELNTTDLTKSVTSAIFSVSDWTWRKRFRVWEANREVFLWPENWLYPELRDNQTSFFKNMMSKLLQSDITEDTSTYAYLEYLSDLESVAKLEPCTTYFDTANSCVHVVGRSPGAKRTYYYRYFDGTSWSGWEQIPLSIEDNPVCLFVWNKRLLLFWLQVVKVPEPSGPPAVDANDPTMSQSLTDQKTTIGTFTSALTSVAPSPSSIYVRIQVNLFWSEYYNGKWQAAKSSNTDLPADLGIVPSAGSKQFNRSGLFLNAYPDGSQNRLWLNVSGIGLSAAAFVFYNTHSSPVTVAESVLPNVFAPDDYTRVIETPVPNTPNRLSMWYGSTDDPGGFVNSLFDLKMDNVVLNAIAPQNPIPSDATATSWITPFFSADTCNTFLVTTSRGTRGPATIPGFGVIPRIPPISLKPPPLIQRSVVELQDIPPKYDPIDPAQNVRRVETSTMQRFVSEDAYVTRALATTGVVTYGSVKIGPSGPISAPTQKSNQGRER